MLVSREQLEYVLGASVDTAGAQFDLKDAIARAVAQADERPDNHDILEEIRKTRIQRNHAIAEFNEITAGLYKGTCVYASEAERILGDRIGAAKSKLLGLANRCARVLLKQKREDALKVLSDAVSEIVGEIRPFRASDFRARDVKEPSSGEPDREEELTDR
jgi:hypothetical protein